MIDPNAMRGSFDILVNLTKSLLGGVLVLVNLFKSIVEAIQVVINAIASFLSWIPGIGKLFEIMSLIVRQFVSFAGLLQDLINGCITYADVFTYLFGLFALCLVASKAVGLSVIVENVPPVLIIAAIITPVVPIGLFSYYYFVKKQSLWDAKEATKDDVFGFIPYCLNNVDVLIYLIVLAIAGTLLTFPILFEYMRDFLPSFIFWDLMILLAIILLGPIALWANYAFRKGQGMLVAIATTRNTLQSWWNSLLEAKKLFNSGGS